MPAGSPLCGQSAVELQRYVPNHHHATATGSNCKLIVEFPDGRKYKCPLPRGV